MSLRHLRVIKCDHCGAVEGADASAFNVRRKLKAKGWAHVRKGGGAKHEGGRRIATRDVDLCPACYTPDPVDGWAEAES